MATRHAESVRHAGGFGIEEAPGLFSEGPAVRWSGESGGLFIDENRLRQTTHR